MIEHSTWHLANAQWGRHVSKAPGDDRLKSKLLCSGHTAPSDSVFSSLSLVFCCRLLAHHIPAATRVLSLTPLASLSQIVFCWQLLPLQIASAVFSEKPSLKLPSQLRVKSYIEAILFSFLTGCTKIKETSTSKYFHFPVLNAVPIVEKVLRKDLLDE